jgi:hypothetical protein
MLQLNGHFIPVYFPMATVPGNAEKLILPDNPALQIQYIINNTLQFSEAWYSHQFPVCCEAYAPGGTMETCTRDGAGHYTPFGFNGFLFKTGIPRPRSYSFPERLVSGVPHRLYYTALALRALEA